MRKNVHKKVDTLLSLVIILIFMPLFVAIIGQRMQLEEIIYGGDAGMENVPGTESNVESGTEAGTVSHKEIEQQLIGIVAKEIEADAEEDAVLAQCVIARTNLCDAKEKHTAEPAALGIEEMRKLWGTYFEECYRRIEMCVKQTEGEVLLWEDDYAYAAYHAISAGSTRDMEELYRDAKMPYLKAQICEADAVAEGYLAVSYWEKTEFVEKCNELFAESGVTSCVDITIASRDKAGYVLTMQVGGTSCDGETFRGAFGLQSACFTITEMDEKVRIVTKGLGHGFGLSQNTAVEMAKNGYNYKEILTYFFSGTTIETV